jgi:Helix-turn-helix domain
MTNESPAFQPKHSLSQRHLTDIQVAEFLNVSVATARRWRLLGGGPRWVRIGGSVRYPFGDLETYLATLPSGGGNQAGKQ